MEAAEHVLEVWGELACFSRPELKVERFSYPVITPSAARGIFDAIYCKPREFRWQVSKVEVLSPPAYISLRRNEVKEKASTRQAQAWMSGKAQPQPIMADAAKSYWGSDMRGRTQRQTMALKNVRYRLHARPRPWPGFEAHLAAITAQFRRRASRGKCFYQPYFGCREFPAYFRLIEEQTPAPPPELDLDIGLMLYDVFDLSRPGAASDAPSVSLFRAAVRRGTMEVPDYEDESVLKCPRRER